MEREILSRTIEASPEKRFDIPLMSSDTDLSVVIINPLRNLKRHTFLFADWFL